MKKISGRCYCGELAFEVTEAPVMKAQCHCRECQYITGGGPNFFMAVPNDGYTYTKGVPQTFTRTDIENPRTREFCKTCGTHMTTLLPDRPLTIVKVGTLDDPQAMYGGPKAAIFLIDKQPFHCIADDVPTYERRP
ncbi:MAG: GFA family protein [Pseudomonadota bacterium]